MAVKFLDAVEQVLAHGSGADDDKVVVRWQLVNDTLDEPRQVLEALTLH